MNETLIAEGHIIVLSDDTYRGVRQRFHRLILNLTNEPVRSALIASEFSDFYRSLNHGIELTLKVLHCENALQIQIAWQFESALSNPEPKLGRRLQLSNRQQLESGEWQHQAVISLGKPASLDAQLCQEILDQRSSEELSHAVTATTNRLKATRTVLHQVQQELNIAADIQRSMLVSEREMNRACLGLDVGALMVPSKEVGGDLYDCIPLGNERYCLCVGDVSGKGVPASLTMSTCLTLVRSYAETLKSPSEMMGRINQRLSHNNESCTFTTLVIGILDVISNSFRYCNAGHNPTFVLYDSGNIDILKDVHGPAVGAMEGISYRESELQLRPLSSIVMYSDGASEMFSPKRERYGFKRMESFFGSAASAGMPRLVRQFMRELKDFADGEPQHDDITILATRLLSRPDSDPDALHIKIQNSISQLVVVKLSMKTFAEQHRINRSTLRKAQVVLDELLSNVVNYGCKQLSEQASIHIDLLRRGHRLLIQIRDPGNPFDPFQAPKPDLDSEVDDRPIGGLGLHMVRQMVSGYRYQRLDGWNQIDLELAV